jgi:rhodanese-related sulfurtransferase
MSGRGRERMRWLGRTAAGAGALIACAVALGFGTNALRSDRLPVVRKPLAQTRRVVARDQLMALSTGRWEKLAVVPSVRPTTGPILGKRREGSLTQPVPQAPEPVSALTPRSPPSKPTDSAKRSRFGKLKQAEPPTHPVAVPARPKRLSPVRAAATQSTKIEALFTTLEDAKDCFDRGNAIFLDARPIEDYESEHIKGALRLSRESFAEDQERVLFSVSKDQLIVTYCDDPECATAIRLADSLVASGYTRVVIMLEGLPGWKAAGYPTARGKETGVWGKASS